ncbi:hypothetical protein D3C76_1248600 [compost metagenome]
MPVDNWHELIGDPTMGDAILDRLVRNAYRNNLKGKSLCKRTKKLTSEGDSGKQYKPCVASLRLPGRMAAEEVAGCVWNTQPGKTGMGGRSAI